MATCSGIWSRIQGVPQVLARRRVYRGAINKDDASHAFSLSLSLRLSGCLSLLTLVTDGLELHRPLCRSSTFLRFVVVSVAIDLPVLRPRLSLSSSLQLFHRFSLFRLVIENDRSMRFPVVSRHVRANICLRRDGCVAASIGFLHRVSEIMVRMFRDECQQRQVSR